MWRNHCGVLIAMPKIDWIVAMAATVLLLGFLAWSLPKLAEYHNNNDQQYQTVANQKGSEPPSYNCNILSAPLSINCSPVPPDGTDNTDYTAQYDLNAQQDMALAAFGVIIATVIGSGISGVTIFFVFRTLLETRTTNEITRKFYELESRPFLSIELVDGEQFRIINGQLGKDRDGEFQEQELLCRLVNGGRTVAIAKKFLRRWEVKRAGNDPSELSNSFIADNELVAKEINVPVGPNAPSAPIITGSTRGEMSSKVTTGDWLYFYGFLEFSDPGEQFRGRIGFCFVYDIRDPTRGIYVALPTENAKYWYYEELQD
ncbi:hypothetical protein GCM10010873_26490 [Cypionkella aquatica]|uniref:Uncharacterized protein n=1 Tax=Cypionkella aquatica TaxID=1756042 RepID=A0AA37TY31_9RHOB|nr:hypothetical protein [Cypionkella aquatica]GLS87675.1 hypothetical protein GCM10010873_26490 [Cypionkella aquatica]